MSTDYLTAYSKSNSGVNHAQNTVRAYLSLTKPRIVVLLSITGIVGFILASKGKFSIIELVIAIFIGYLSAGGAMTINAYLDRDIDSLMERTSQRASVGENAINPPEKILLVGSIFVIAALALAFLVFNALTAFFVGWGAFYYLLGYSLVLKRRSIVNTLLGGLASPAPVLMGYAAITGTIPLEGWLLGFLVFFWTPSHTWSLATKYVEDYRRANIPMLPVVYGIPRTAQITFGWGILVIAYATVLTYVMTNGSIIILLLILIPHFFLFSGLYRFLKTPSEQTAYRSFKLHNIWLALIFAAMLLPF